MEIMKEWNFDNHKRWTDLLAITLQDYHDINNGLSKPSHLLQLSFADDLMVVEDGLTKKPSRMAPKHCSIKISTRKKHPMISNTSETPPLMPVGMRQNLELGMGAVDLQWVGNKDLTDTDCNPSQARLNLPHEVDSCFTEPEKGFLRGTKENKMDVLVVDPLNRVWDMKICYWPSAKRYVFIGGWTDFVRKNGIRPNVHTAQIWSFRKEEDDDDQRLCFALNIV